MSLLKELGFWYLLWAMNIFALNGASQKRYDAT